VYYLSRTNHDPIWTAHVEMKTLHIIYGLRMRGPRYGIKNSLKRGELSGHFRGGCGRAGQRGRTKLILNQRWHKLNVHSTYHLTGNCAFRWLSIGKKEIPSLM